MTDIRIIGGGILGATLAWELSVQGATVEVVDAGLSDRASIGSLAWLNASSSADPDYSRVRAKSVRLWHKIKADHRDAPLAFPGAALFSAEGDLAAHAAHLASVGWSAEVVSPAQIKEKAAHLVAPSSALFAPDEGFADPRRVTDWMRAQAEAAGAAFVDGTASVGRTDRPTVVTAGPSAKALLAQAGVVLPLRRSPGILMRTSPAQQVIPFAMATPKLDLWQGEDGCVFMSSSLSKTPHRADDLMVGDALAELARLFPVLDGLAVEEVTRRDRPIPDDGFPIVGRAGPPNLWLAATHSGMTLAPVIAQALTDDILERPARHDLGRYALDRDPLHVKEAVIL